MEFVSCKISIWDREKKLTYLLVFPENIPTKTLSYFSKKLELWSVNFEVIPIWKFESIVGIYKFKLQV